MAKAVIGYINRAVDAGVFAVTSAQAALPKEYLVDDHLATKWRSTSLATQNIDVDAGSAVAWGAFGLFGTNLTAAATWTISLGATQGSSSVYSSGSISAGVVAGYGQAIHVLAADLSARWCRLALADAANPDGFMEAGALFAGPLFRPTRNFSYQRAHGFVDPSIRSKAKGGQLYTDARDKFRAAEFEFKGLTQAEVYSDALEIDRRLGLSGNLLFVPDYASAYAAKETIFGPISDASPAVHAVHPAWAKRYRIEERL